MSMNKEVERQRPTSIEHKLALSVLEQACADLVDFGENARADRLDALRFFILRDVKAYDGRPWLFSFESVCEILDYDPQAWRSALFKRFRKKYRQHKLEEKQHGHNVRRRLP